MYKHLNRVLRIPYHKLYISCDENFISSPRTKARIKRLMKSREWLYGIKQIDTNYRDNCTTIHSIAQLFTQLHNYSLNCTTIHWRGKYA